MNEKFEIMNPAIIGKWKEVIEGDEESICEFTKDGEFYKITDEEHIIDDFSYRYKFLEKKLIEIEEQYTGCSRTTEMLIIPVNDDKMFLVILELKEYHEYMRIK